MRLLRGRSVRAKLAAIVVLVAFLEAVLLIATAFEQRRVRADLSDIEGEYLPLFDLGSDVNRQFAALTKSLQDAVAAADLDALKATEAQKDALIARLDQAPPSVSRVALHDLEATVDGWYAAATDISRRLIEGESGLQLTSDIAAMEARQHAVQAGIQSTVSLDRRRLAAAFEEARRVLREASALQLILRLALSLAVLTLAIGLARTILRSLTALGAAFERFGRGEFGVPVEVGGDDELAEVARLANRMAANLDDLNARLRARQAELERANRELESFSYSVSHDLRAPLRAIDGFSRAVVEDYAEQLPEKGRDYLHRVRAAAQRMGQLIDDILRLSRITRADLKPTEVDVTAMAGDLARELQRAEPERQVEFAIEPGLTARADAQLLRIVLENLLSNAWKFTGKTAAARITLGPVALDGLAGFYVQDNGAGFDATHAARLFTPFQRLHVASEFPGTGIGLATVQRVVNRHGGRVWAEGEVDHGAKFFVVFPRDDDGGEAER